MSVLPNHEARDEREALTLIAWHALLQRDDMSIYHAAKEAHEAVDWYLREREQRQGGA